MNRAVGILSADLPKSQEVDTVGNVNTSANVSKNQTVDAMRDTSASSDLPKNQEVDTVEYFNTSTDLSKDQGLDAVGSVNASADLSKNQELDPHANTSACAESSKNQDVDAVRSMNASAIASRSLKPNCIHRSMDPTSKSPEEEVSLIQLSLDWANTSALSSSNSTDVSTDLLETDQSTPALDTVDQQLSGPTVREGSQVSSTLNLLMMSTEEASLRKPSDVSERLVYDHLPPRESLRTIVMMVIHKLDGQTLNRVAKLDTGAEENIISQQVVDKLGLVVHEYTGGPLQSVGSSIFPKGRVSFEWHVARKTKTYNTSFAVLPTSLCDHFDILLSAEEIEKIGFFKVDNTIFFLTSSDMEFSGDLEHRAD